MEALTLLAHGFAVLLTWKILSLMLLGLFLTYRSIDSLRWRG